jgi:ABC-type transporter Mla subunit MlaD
MLSLHGACGLKPAGQTRERICMTVTDLLANGSYIDFALFLLIIIACLSLVVVHRKSKKKTEEKINVLFDSANKLKVKNRELSKRIGKFLETNETILAELESKIELLKASIDNTQEDLSSAAQARQKETKRIEQRLGDFSKEIQQMKDYIREWAIDMEL